MQEFLLHLVNGQVEGVLVYVGEGVEYLVGKVEALPAGQLNPFDLPNICEVADDDVGELGVDAPLQVNVVHPPGPDPELHAPALQLAYKGVVLHHYDYVQNNLGDVILDSYKILDNLILVFLFKIFVLEVHFANCLEVVQDVRHVVYHVHVALYISNANHSVFKKKVDHPDCLLIGVVVEPCVPPGVRGDVVFDELLEHPLYIKIFREVLP